MLLPTVAEIQEMKEKRRLQAIISKIACSCIFLGCFCCIFLLISGKWIGIFLFKSPLAGNFILTLAWICPFLYTNTVLLSMINGLGKTTCSFLFNLFSLCIRITGVFLFIPAAGISGYLNGLLILVEGNELRTVATDGHRLAYASMQLEGDAELPRQELILPRKTVLELSRLLADNDESLQIELTSNQIRFQFGNINLVSKLIDGKFPDYERVIPATLKNFVTLNRATLLQSMVRAAILTNEKFRGVRLVLTPGSLKIMAANAEQEEAQEEIEVDYSGDAIDVGFNVGYLLDVLNNSSAEAIEWGFNDANSSSLLTVPGNERFKYVVMPMRI